VGLVISECQGLYGQLEGQCGEGGEAVEVAEHQVAVLVAAEDLVVGGDESGYPVAGCLTHQVPTIEGEHVQGVACLVVACEDDVALVRDGQLFHSEAGLV